VLRCSVLMAADTHVRGLHRMGTTTKDLPENQAKLKAA
jgi:hypothetical protein